VQLPNKSSMDCLGPSRAGPGSERTEILFNDGGIVEIYHLDKQANEADFGW
jgi:hypothetical protein